MLMIKNIHLSLNISDGVGEVYERYDISPMIFFSIFIIPFMYYVLQ